MFKDRFYGFRIKFGGPKKKEEKKEPWWKRIQLWTSPMEEDPDERDTTRASISDPTGHSGSE